jgi:hypothetical protein
MIKISVLAHFLAISWNLIYEFQINFHLVEPH